jgi:serine/threonine-protein kinase
VPEVEAASSSWPDPDSGAMMGVKTVMADGPRTGSNPTAAPGLPTGVPGDTGLHAQARTPAPVANTFPRLGRYQLVSRLATGGMAEVYLARHGELSGFKTLVVVKKVLPHLAQNPDFIAMFLDEARIASLLDHPNVVRIYEVGRAQNEYFLAMELVQGKPLASLVQRSERLNSAIDHKLAALVVAQAAAGLQHAHELKDPTGAPLGLVHRDVSPQNILISFEGSVKLIDFGIARALGRLNDTQNGSMKGKIGYMAPEQARGEDVDPRADVFALGVVLWELVTGRRLFRRDTEFATMRAVLDDPIDFPSNVAEVNEELDDIVMKALAREPAERYQAAEEMRADLDRFVFKSGGATARDLARVMKDWFAPDYAQWQTAARVALDMRESDPPIEMSFPDLLASRSGLSRTSSSGPRALTGSGVPRAALSPAWDSTSKVLRVGALTNSARNPARARRKLILTVSGAAALIAVLLIALVLSLRGAPPPAPVRPTPGRSARPIVEEFPSHQPLGGEQAAAPGKTTTPAEVAGETTRPPTKKHTARPPKGAIMPPSSQPKKSPATRPRSREPKQGPGARPNPF